MRTWARMAGAAVAVSAALLLSGCTEDSANSGGDNGAAGDKAAQDTGGSQGGGEEGAEANSGPVEVADVKGNWETGSVTDGDYVVLNLTDDDLAVAVTQEATCNGSFSQEGEAVALELECGKKTGLEKGTIEGASNGELTVAWASGETDVFTPTD